MTPDLRIGDIAAEAWGLFIRARTTYLSVVFVAAALSIIGDWLVEVLTGRNAPTMNAGAIVIAMLLSAFSSALALQMMGPAPASNADGTPERRAWLMMRRRLPSVVGAGLVAGLFMMVGVLLLVVPALYLMCRWLVSTAAILAEDRNWQAGMQRSAWLTEGVKWSLLPLCLAYLGAVFGAAMVVTMVVMALLPAGTLESVSLVHASVPLAFAANFIMTGMSALGSIGQAVIYRRLADSRGPMPAPAPGSAPL